MSIQNVMVTADIAARRRSGVLAGLAILVVLLALISLGIGPVRLSPVAVIDALFGGGTDVQQVIVRGRRISRTITCCTSVPPPNKASITATGRLRRGAGDRAGSRRRAILRASG